MSLTIAEASRKAGDRPVLDRVFGALADPVRRAILSELEAGDRLVSELARPFDISLQAISRHIQVLVRAGLIVQARSGRISRCHLEASPIFEAALWLNRYSKYWQVQFDTLAAWLDQIERDKAPPPRRKRRRKAKATRGARHATP